MAGTRVKRATPVEAWKAVQEDPRAIILDVRTTIEYRYVGHPVGAVHVPWQEAPGWEINRNFLAEVRNALRERRGDDEDIEGMCVFAICRSGKRSLAAGEELAMHGFKNVYNIEEGFEGNLDEHRHRGTINGWRFHALPWEQT
ncbi:MAG: rhodanese-like domain-containing protein [Gammaproteobacteria bacterium]|nr:rhodanese-like domain-containing protein [Gammaproteobacteria bacterium]MCI0591428.1 rhodanese-like domain-containing protein [Gammaproteobacteria bacterium]